MMESQSDCFLHDILPNLPSTACAPHHGELDFEQQQRLRDGFLREVSHTHAACRRPRAPLPFISNLSLSLGVLPRDPSATRNASPAPKCRKTASRRVSLDNPLHFVPLEQIMIHNLDALFPSMDVLAAYPFRVTRNADIARNEEEADDLLEMINEELREQRFAAVVRLEIDANMPDDMLGLLRNELGLEMDDIYPVRGPLRLADLFMLADINLPHLKYEPWTPLTPPRLAGLDRTSRAGEIFSIIRQGDLLVHHPYHSFGASTQQFIEAAARDPQYSPSSRRSTVPAPTRRS